MFFFTDFVQCGAKEFPIDQRIQCGEEVVELIDIFEWVFSVEEAKLSVAHEK